MADNLGPGPDPGQIDGAATSPDGHTTMFWNEDGVAHRVSFDGPEGHGEHYVQTDGQGTRLVYDYQSGQWIDQSK